MPSTMQILFAGLCKNFPEFLYHEDVCECYRMDFLNELVTNDIYLSEFEFPNDVFKYVIEQWMLCCDPIDDLALHLTNLLVSNIGNEEKRSFLLGLGADINGACNGKPPFFSLDDFETATWKRICEIDGFDINARNRLGDTILIHFCRRDTFDSVVSTLLRNGVDVNAANNVGKSALMYAVEFQNDSSVVNALIESGADVNARDKHDRSALFYIRNTETKELLVKAGARTDFTDVEELDFVQHLYVRNGLYCILQRHREFNESISQLVSYFDHGCLCVAAILAVHSRKFAECLEMCEKFVAKWKYLPREIRDEIREIMPHDSVLWDSFDQFGNKIAYRKNLEDQLISEKRQQHLLISGETDKLEYIRLPKCRKQHAIGCEAMRKPVDQLPESLRADAKRHNQFGVVLQKYFNVELEERSESSVIRMIRRFVLEP